MTREEAIKSMYQYEAEVEDMVLVTDTQEVIHNWYIVAFPEVAPLEDMFPLEDLYDSEPACKVYVKDRYRY